MTVEYKLFDKVVNHPVLKVASVFFTIIFSLLTLILSPLLVPTHLLLRRIGRNGFYFNSRIVIGKESFARHEPWPQGSVIGMGLRRF